MTPPALRPTFTATPAGVPAPDPPAPAAHPLRVTHLCTTAVRGGAARAAFRLHRALGPVGVASQMLVAQQFSADEGTLEYNPLRPAPAALGRIFFRLGRRWHRPSFRRAGAFFTSDRTLAGHRLPRQLPPCDVVNLHWVADLLDYRVLPRLADRAALVWTFHDMNAFTGGCHYSGPCRRYADHCGFCPQLRTSAGEHDLTHRVMGRKLAVFRRIPPGRLVVVCPTRWLAGEAGRSSLCRGFDTRVIPNGIDPAEFYATPRDEARRRLGLPARARIVLFVAENVADRRKGFRHLLEAVAAIRDLPNLLLLTLGRGDAGLADDPLSRHLGTLHDSAGLRDAYSAADVFAIPSLQDNLPNTILEAMACGTPVVGFDAGGIGEAVVDGQTGLLAPNGHAAGLASALRRLLVDDPLRRTLAGNCRPRIEQEYTIQLQAKRYALLYGRILQRKPAPRPAGHLPGAENGASRP